MILFFLLPLVLALVFLAALFAASQTGGGR